MKKVLGWAIILQLFPTMIGITLFVTNIKVHNSEYNSLLFGKDPFSDGYGIGWVINLCIILISLIVIPAVSLILKKDEDDNP